MYICAHARKSMLWVVLHSAGRSCPSNAGSEINQSALVISEASCEGGALRASPSQEASEITIADRLISDPALDGQDLPAECRITQSMLFLAWANMYMYTLLYL